MLKIKVRDIDKQLYEMEMDFSEKTKGYEKLMAAANKISQEPYIVMDRFCENGEVKYMQYCSQCGELSKVNTPRWHCSCFDNKMEGPIHVYYGSPIQTKRYVYVAEETDNIIKLIIFQAVLTQNQKKNGDDFSWLKAPFNLNRVLIEVYGIYTKELGFIFKRPKYVPIRRNSSTSLYYLQSLKECEWINHDKIDLDTVQAPVVKKRTNTVLKIEPKLTVKNEDILKSLDMDLYALVSRIGDTETIALYCHSCGHITEINRRDASEIRGNENICPHCGHPYSVTYHSDTISQSDSSQTLVYDTDDNNNLVIRIFKSKRILKGNQITERVDETFRIVADEKKYRCYEKNEVNGTYIKGPLNLTYAPLCTIQSLDEICGIIKGSKLKFSGLAEAFTAYEENKTKMKFFSKSYIGKGCYLFEWYKKPYMELIIKAGLYEICCNFIVSGHINLKNEKATDVCSLLGFSHAVFKMVREHNLSLGNAEMLQRICQLEPSITYKEFEVIMSFGYNKHRLLRIKEDFGISFRRSLSYLENVKKNQCIMEQDTLILWSDYLKIAKEIGYNLKKDKSKLFPASLKKEHDRATFTYNVVVNPEQTERFVNKAKETQRYEYAYKNLQAIVPQKPEEVVAEGTALRHCVASYVSSIINGNCIIVFIRRKNAPDESFYTVEINDEIIIQVNGHCCCKPNEPEVIEFLEHWAKVKKLKIAANCHAAA